MYWLFSSCSYEVNETYVLLIPFLVTSFFHFFVTLVVWFSLWCVPFVYFLYFLNICLAYLAFKCILSKKVNKHDYVIFLYFRNFIDQNWKTKNGMKNSHCSDAFHPYSVWSISILITQSRSSHNVYSCKVFHQYNVVGTVSK